MTSKAFSRQRVCQMRPLREIGKVFKDKTKTSPPLKKEPGIIMKRRGFNGVHALVLEFDCLPGKISMKGETTAGDRIAKKLFSCIEKQRGKGIGNQACISVTRKEKKTFAGRGKRNVG